MSLFGWGILITPLRAMRQAVKNARELRSVAFRGRRLSPHPASCGVVGDQIWSHEAPDLGARWHDVDHCHVTKVRIVGIVEPVLSDESLKIVDVRLPALRVVEQRFGEDGSCSKSSPRLTRNPMEGITRMTKKSSNSNGLTSMPFSPNPPGDSL